MPTAEPTNDPGIQPTPETSLEPTNEPSGMGAGEQLDCGVAIGDIANARLNDAAKSDLLCLHNESRSQIALGDFVGLSENFPVATNMKRLQWDSKLEQVAQGWASNCNWQHNGNRENEYHALSPTDIAGNPVSEPVSVGENLAFKGISNVLQASYQFALDGYQAWEDEGQYYSLGAYAVSDYCAQAPCGHFTQLIWANTYKVGCAVNYCAAGTLSSVPATFLVCNYASAGNYLTQWPYQTGTDVNQVCSTADSDQTECHNGLTQSAAYSSGL